MQIYIWIWHETNNKTKKQQSMGAIRNFAQKGN